MKAGHAGGRHAAVVLGAAFDEKRDQLLDAGVVADQHHAFRVSMLVEQVVEHADGGVVDLVDIKRFDLAQCEGGGFLGALGGRAKDAVVGDVVRGKPFASGAGFVATVFGQTSLAIVLAVLAVRGRFGMA